MKSNPSFHHSRFVYYGEMKLNPSFHHSRFVYYGEMMVSKSSTIFISSIGLPKILIIPSTKSDLFVLIALILCYISVESKCSEIPLAEDGNGLLKADFSN